MESNPDIAARVEELFRRALVEYEAGRLLPALRLTEEVARLPAPCRGLHRLRAACLHSLGRQSEALAAVELDLASPRPEPASIALRIAIQNALAAQGQRGRQARRWEVGMPVELVSSLQAASHRYEYRGIPMIKNPFDFALYPQLLWRLKPGTIFEIGSFSGGSALWLGDTLDNYGLEGSRIYSSDVVPVTSVQHPRVTFLDAGGSRPLADVFPPDLLAQAKRPFLVIEDADHTYNTTRSVLEHFHPHLRSGEYMVVEDTIICEGVCKALADFHTAHPGAYTVDADYCDFWGYNLTWCMNSFLRKV